MATRPPDEAPGALLQEVTRAGFVPPPPPDPLLAEEARLRGEVDDFAAAFFATPVEPRRQRWQALSEQCSFSPPLTARLSALQPALDLDLGLGDIGNPRTAQLASHVAGLFVLAPAARAAQRQAVLRGMQADIGGWEENARQLQAVAPAVAALEPTLLVSVLGWREQQQRLARARVGRQPVSRPAPGRVARAAAAAPPAPAAKGSGGRAVGWLCAGVGFHSSPDVPQFDPQKFQVPQQIDPKVFDQMDRIPRFNQDEEDRQRFIQDEQEKNQQVEPGQAGPWRKDVPWPPPGPNERPPWRGPETRRER
jgi:hypothetical protein